MKTKYLQYMIKNPRSVNYIVNIRKCESKYANEILNHVISVFSIVFMFIRIQIVIIIKRIHS